MSLLEDEIRRLEQDLAADAMRISAYHDLPFAIFCYDPAQEFNCRKHIRLLAISLKQNHHKSVTFISLGRTMVPIILFYPGSVEGGADLRFMNLEDRPNLGAYNYRVKIYGGN